MRPLAILAALGASAFLPADAAVSKQPVAQPVVVTESGAIMGAAANGIEFFRGIPYASPPMGALRWEPPQPAAHWPGVRKAIRFAHDCAQKPVPGDIVVSRASFSEDCLYLNIWRPSVSQKRLPVMVWIHGGGFVNGGSSAPIFDGTKFAEGGVILVSFNYRLGRFGFFGFPALTAENPDGLLGDYGYMDQIAAFKWVKANIAAFGGDPNNVTVFGESAGGGSVHMLLTSPLAAGLFNKAIVESGGGRGSLMGPRRLHEDLPGLPSAETIGVNFAKANGIDGTGPKALAALRALPAKKILDGLNMMTMLMAGPPTYAGPIQDGKIVVGSPDEMYRTGRWAKIPVMIGANSADIGFSTAKTMNEVLAPFGADSEKARDLYDPDHTGDVAVVGQTIAADRLMVEPARLTAQLVSDQGIPSYEYRFSYVSAAATEGISKRGPKNAPWLSKLKGASHASELVFVFDTISDLYKNASREDKAMAKDMQVYWINFAKTGNPNEPDLPQWPSYSRQKDMLMNFTQDGPKAMADPWRARLDLIAAHSN
ncbi:MAG: carboxylesterase family protein [Alphaproteobacteria bacterium]|nr:carboxylesterase family protein [Alphaproteobacteria bacterium]MDE2494034.1 carboxylesterase family protein [Alphaproteobacteria bacterium]